MVPINLKSLVAKLNETCRRSLEGAAGLCLSRTHYNVEIEHWLLKLLEMPNTDLAAVLRHYEVDPSRLLRALTAAIDRFKTGNARPPGLSPHIVDLDAPGVAGGVGRVRRLRHPLGPVALRTRVRRRIGPNGQRRRPRVGEDPRRVAPQGAPQHHRRHGRGRGRAGRGGRDALARRSAGHARRALADAFAGPVHHRPDRPGEAGGHRSGAGTRRRDSSGHRHPHAPPAKQPDPDRRGGRRQDGRGRGFRAADRRRRRSAAAGQRHAADARPRPAPGRGRDQGGVREPAQVGHRRGQGLAPPDHPLHRRGPHDDRRRRPGRPGRRGQHAQAGPGPRRAADDRRHDLGGVQEVLREGRGPGPAVPGRQDRGADRGRLHRDDARAGGNAGEAPQGPHPRRGRGRRRAAFAPLHFRAAVARQGREPAGHGGGPGGDRADGRAAAGGGLPAADRPTVHQHRHSPPGEPGRGRQPAAARRVDPEQDRGRGGTESL